MSTETQLLLPALEKYNSLVLLSGTVFTSMKYPLIISISLLLSACVSQQIQSPSVVEGTVLQAPDSTPSIDIAAIEKTAEPDQNPTTIADFSVTEPVAGPLEEADTWERIRRGFQLEHFPDRPQTRSELAWYRSHQKYLDRVAARADRYLFYVLEEIEKRGLPTELALLPIVESAYDPFAYSHGQAMGMWQFIPATGRLYGLKQDWWYDGRRDLVASTQAALDYLEALSKEFDHDWQLALAAYNSGAGNVRSAIRKNRKLGKPTDFWSLKLPTETQAYVPRLLAIALLVSDPEGNGVTLATVPSQSYFVEVDAGAQIDLTQAARLAEISMKELYLLNPGFNKWATHPDGPHRLLVPVSQGPIFDDNLAQLPESERIGWRRHKIRSGESLGKLAQKYNTTIDTLRQTNKIRGNTIRAGDSLIIPVSLGAPDNYVLSSENRLKSKLDHYEALFGQTQTEYRVKPGDSLWLISRRFNVDMRSLAKWNGMATTDILKPGAVLRVFQPAQIAVTTVPVNQKIPGSLRKLSYKVRPGESLSLIAGKFNLDVGSIRKWNSQLAGKKYLQPGQRLTLYVNVTDTR